VTPVPEPPRRRRPRRAVGPPGALDADEPALDLDDERRQAPPEDDPADRYRAEQPPHHDRGV